MRPAPAFALPVLLVAVACGGQSLRATTLHPAAPTHEPAAHSGTTPTCLTGGLSLRLGRSGAAAGSRYQPIVFTNTTAASCTLAGYPGVSFVAPGTGHQVGASATRNAQHATTTVTLAPGASASALLQIVNHANYPPADCKAMTVSGLRVYPPGNTAAAYLPFNDDTQACSSQEEQLAVDAVVAGSTG